MNRSLLNSRVLTIIALLLVGASVTFAGALQDVSIGTVDGSDTGLSLDEQAYYEYVAPRLEVLVNEVNITAEMVEGKSRDLIALTRAGNTIDTLTSEIRSYGETHTVPPRFADLHARILGASDTVTSTFDEARKALRTFNFSSMRGLVQSFTTAATEFNACKDELDTLVSG